MRVAFELMRPRVVNDTWQADSVVHYWDEGDAHVAANAIDESGKIDLNSASDALLKGLFQSAGGLDVDAAQRIVDVIDDWKDADDLRRPNGAEAPDYKAAGLSYTPANAPFESVAELQRVLGMTPSVYAAVADNLTVFSKSPGVNPAFASRSVLLAVPGATAEVVDTYLPSVHGGAFTATTRRSTVPGPKGSLKDRSPKASRRRDGRPSTTSAFTRLSTMI